MSGRLLSRLWIALLFGVPGASCDLSTRDQALLITASETTPEAGMREIASMIGAEVECAELGPFRIVRYKSGGMYVLDPSSAFERWEQTGVSFTGGPSRALRSYFDVYRNSRTYTLWQSHGRGRFTTAELKAMAIDTNARLPWRRIRLLDRETYRAAKTQKASGDEEQVVSLLLFEKVRMYIEAEKRDAVQILEITPGEILENVPTTAVVVSYREKKQGITKTMTLHVPINPTLPPYVGYPAQEQALDPLNPPLTNGFPRP